MNQSTSDNSRAKIVLGYVLPFLGLIFYLTEKRATNSEKRNYAQAGTAFIVLLVFQVGMSILLFLSIPFLGWIKSILTTLIYIFCVIAAITSTKTHVYPIPVLFDLSKSIFK